MREKILFLLLLLFNLYNPTACVATLHTLPVNYTELQNQRVGCVRYARGCLIDGLPFQLLTSLKLALSDSL